MPPQRHERRRAPLAAGVLGVGVLGVAVIGAALVPSVAGASHRHHLPKITHAGDLSAEPVVKASRGRPPGKLLVKNLVTGTGAAVTSTSTVSVKYVGANYRTGKDFTQVTWQSGRPTSFPLSGVIPGFAQGLVGMKIGGRREIVIPPRLGYGNHASGPVKANETLVFVVDLEGVTG